MGKPCDVRISRPTRSSAGQGRDPKPTRDRNDRAVAPRGTYPPSAADRTHLRSDGSRKRPVRRRPPRGPRPTSTGRGPGQGPRGRAPSGRLRTDTPIGNSGPSSGTFVLGPPFSGEVLGDLPRGGCRPGPGEGRHPVDGPSGTAKVLDPTRKAPGTLGSPGPGRGRRAGCAFSLVHIKVDILRVIYDSPC